MSENTIWQGHPSMVRNNPFLFLICLLLSPLGVGILILFVWWLSIKSTTLIITSQRTTYRWGLLSKHTNEVRHSDIRNIKVDQTFLERVMGIGNLAISSAGQGDMEIVAKGMPKPQRLADMIRKLQ